MKQHYRFILRAGQWTLHVDGKPYIVDPNQDLELDFGMYDFEEEYPDPPQAQHLSGGGNIETDNFGN